MGKYRKNRRRYKHDDISRKDYEYSSKEEKDNFKEDYVVPGRDDEGGEIHFVIGGRDTNIDKDALSKELPGSDEKNAKKKYGRSHREDLDKSPEDGETSEEYPEDEETSEEYPEDEETSEEYPEDEETSEEYPEDGETSEEYPEDGETSEEYPEDEETSEECPEDEEASEECPEDEETSEECPEDEEASEECPEDEETSEECPEDEETSEEYPEDEEEYEEDIVAIRRRARRKRRIRNQILAYLLLVVLLAGIGTCGYLVVHKVIQKVHSKQEQQKIDDQIEALSEREEEIVIEPPKVVEEEEEEEEVKEVDYLSEIVEACISEMPIEDKIAQLFIVTPESVTGANKVTQAGEKTKEALEKYAVGGFIYFGSNIVDREQLTNMISTTDGYRKYRMFFAVDEEGGTCSRVSSSKIEVPDVGPMADIGASGDPLKAFQAGQTIGTYLKEIGFNVDFAPVADIVTVTENSAIGDRSFGADPQEVGQMVARCVEGIQNSGISACLKHFPGLGDTTEDTHKGRAVITKTLDELQNTNFESFRAGIEAGADFIMVGHATAENADDSGLPCSMSKNMIKGQLRDYLGYDGVVITDALNMNAVTDYYTTEEICLKAIKAGVDILLMPDDFEKAYNALLEAVNDGTISEERVDESLRRIFSVKFKNEMNK